MISRPMDWAHLAALHEQLPVPFLDAPRPRSAHSPLRPDKHTSHRCGAKEQRGNISFSNRFAHYKPGILQRQGKVMQADDLELGSTSSSTAPRSFSKSSGAHLAKNRVTTDMLGIHCECVASCAHQACI